MITVNVFNAHMNECIDSRSFELRDNLAAIWANIGSWLDHYNYVSDHFYMKIRYAKVPQSWVATN